jgi:hypothetical protein
MVRVVARGRRVVTEAAGMVAANVEGWGEGAAARVEEAEMEEADVEAGIEVGVDVEEADLEEATAATAAAVMTLLVVLSGGRAAVDAVAAALRAAALRAAAPRAAMVSLRLVEQDAAARVGGSPLATGRKRREQA